MLIAGVDSLLFLCIFLGLVVLIFYRGTIPIWWLVHSCLKEGLIKRGRRALKVHQDSLSESDSREGTQERPKRKGTKAKDRDPKENKGGEARLYPSLDGFDFGEFANLNLSDDEGHQQSKRFQAPGKPEGHGAYCPPPPAARGKRIRQLGITPQPRWRPSAVLQRHRLYNMQAVAAILSPKIRGSALLLLFLFLKTK